MKHFAPLEIEKEISEFWKKKGIYERVRKSREKSKPFFFADGPPYATGNIHMGTAQNKILKDAYIRFWRMQGFNVWDQPGYDTHGLPIEYQVEKNLGFTSKKDIESYGTAKFIKKCRSFATRFIGVMNDQFRDLGVWMDWERPYLTLNNSYIEAAWYTFKKAFENGHLYKDKYPVHVCPRCETAVSYNEIEYKKLADPSVFVKFPVKGEERTYFVIWTTTPWTLPANTGIMANPDFEYSYIKTEYGDTLIIAAELADKVLEKAGIEGYHVLKTVKGEKIIGLEYEHPLRDLVPALQNLKNAHRVVGERRHVSLDEGTGLVHTAPGHGAEDYRVGKREGLPVISPLNLDGTFSGEAGKWLEGKFSKSCDPIIIEKLSERNSLLKKETVVHDYPTCWRCSSPLLQMSVPQWFFRIEEIKDRIIKENEKVRWIPKWAGDRFRDWLTNLGDWPISRQRYWGIPLPIWECSCGHIEVIGSYEELRKKANLKEEIDFHRPDIDNVLIKCPECKKDMKRTPDVLDVWFDSGVSTWAALEYPRKKKLFEKLWPADFETEGPDQIRGWWNSQMITSMLTFGKAPFKNILFHGFVLDAKGVKMSKSKGNIVTPAEVIEKYGRDVMRFYLLSSAPWDDFYFNWDGVRETYKIFNVFWNVYEFVRTYAPEPVRQKPELEPEDLWILSRLNSLIKRTDAIKQYKLHQTVQEIGNFILNEFSRWYIKLIRDRVSVWYKGKDKQSAQWTLRHVLKKTILLMAPVSPYIAEKFYQGMGGENFSVHAESWPEADKSLISPELEDHMETIKAIVEAMAFARQEKRIKLKWPLSDVYIYTKEKRVSEAVKSLEKTLKLMGNVKNITLLRKSSGDMKEFPGGMLAIGGVVEEEVMLRELIRKIQVMRKKEGLHVTETIRTWIKSDSETEKTLEKWRDDISSGTGSMELHIGEIRKEKDKLEVNGRTIHIGFEKTEAGK